MIDVAKMTLRAATPLAIAVAALAADPPTSQAVLSIAQANSCSDAYQLKNIAFDARMTAVMMYYKGFIQNAGDRERQDCLRTHVLRDGGSVVIDRTMDLIDSQCLPIEAAARQALADLCP
ncbi:hypothetical protein DFR50_12548 [Roseiarcus fermentans]|uniref:HdeA/HdeB family protein n=1 Tax=Roseiarcus fermentans TaxID=1473586 RepID=A0A366F339_9HYPH|nr:hypothetical protein [Roseiarcus fermentans]RBP08566.1 hypothetical protein DFR50_12548 [Roseiarcus fermentans]